MTMELPQSSPSLARSASRASTLSFIPSRLRKIKTISVSTENTLPPESQAALRGPLGLNLLHEPSEPRVDIVFIHGLGGGSRKTWSLSSHPATFWPKAWLPSESGFKHARTQSYGYNSDWATSKQSRLTVHDFGQALLADLYNCPHLRRNSETPIIFVAHSMGGLVAKKAYLLATRDPLYGTFATRIRSIFFLGTPHRGSDSAQLLKRLLASSLSRVDKAFVDDLIPGSGTLQSVNDEFRHVANNLQLWSFFEVLPTTIGPTTTMIVDKDSSIVGLPHEHVQYLNADHRNLCKFDSPDNSNYTALKRCILTCVENVERNYLSDRETIYHAEMKRVSNLLQIHHRPDADFLAVSEKQHVGSCAWLTDSEVFESWLGLEDTSDMTLTSPEETFPPAAAQSPKCSPKLLWLHGRPGMGKSVASGHAISYLKACNHDCSFFFLGHNAKQKSTVAEMLRSLAYQMAESSYDVRRILSDMVENGERLNLDDSSSLWSNLFAGRLFRIRLPQPHYWVIDGLDECSSKTLPSLIHMLCRLPSNLRLRILATSRPGGAVERLFRQERNQPVEIQMTVDQSLQDIESFLRNRRPQIGSQQQFGDLIRRVLEKCNGIFLWASLVMSRMEEAYSLEDMHAALNDLPSEMNDFYLKIVDTIASSPSSELVRCILKWVVCSPALLSSDEMREAVRIDIGRTLTATDGQLEGVCGHLITVKAAGVQVAHQTIASFLTQHESPFRVLKSDSHSRLAEICLAQLTGSEFVPARTKRDLMSSKRTQTSPLAKYACVNFSHHLSHSSSAIDKPLLLLVEFLRGNVLTWIEMVARTGDLSIITRTVQHLRTYLSRRAKYRSPLGTEVHLVEQWTNDLARIVAAFGSHLVEAPTAIHFLVPQLCPTSSPINAQFSKRIRTLKVAGRMEKEWDDRISSLVHQTAATCVASCDQFLAVGLPSGVVILYSNDTWDEIRNLHHGQPVRHLCFGLLSPLLASCSSKMVKVWNKDGTCRWTKNLSTMALSIRFMDFDNLLYIPGREVGITILNVSDGSRGDDSLRYVFSYADSSDSDSLDHSTRSWAQPPGKVKICPKQNLAALTYRNSAVVIWDLQENEKLGVFEKEGTEGEFCSPPVSDAVFNPIQELELLAIAYRDGTIATCNPYTMEQVSFYNVTVETLATSPDGRVLATGDLMGIIYLFAFETLRPLYRISALEERIMSMCFASDGLRLFDVRGTACNVWEPSILIGDGSDDTSTEPVSEEAASQIVPTVHASHFLEIDDISSMAIPASGDVVICGREDGNIDIYDPSSAVVVKSIAVDGGRSQLRYLEWNETANILLSLTTTGRVRLSRFKCGRGAATWEHAGVVAGLGHASAISQVLLSSDGTHLLMATQSGDELRNVAEGTCLATLSPLSDNQCRTWMTHPMDNSLLLLFVDGCIHLYNWDSLCSTTAASGIRINNSSSTAKSSRWFSRASNPFLINLSIQHGGATEVRVFDTGEIKPTIDQIQPVLHKHIPSGVKACIGIFRSSFYFVDGKGWICSLSLKNPRVATTYTRHFFIPRTWQVGTNQIVRVISKNVVAYARRDELVVFHGYLDFEEKVPLDAEPIINLS